jgi:GT2 family glycosyltransferase
MLLADDLTIIVVTYNSMKVFPEFISSLHFSLKYEKCSIIVIDNNSQDNIEKFINESHPNVKFLKNIKNEGYGAAINRGIVEAKTPFVAIMNPDVIVEEGGFIELVNFLKENKSAAAVSGALFHRKNFTKNIDFDEFRKKNKFSVNLKFLKLIYRALYYSGIKTRFRRLKFLSPWSLVSPQDSIKVARLNGSFGVFNRKALTEVNLFDSRLFLYFEEDDIALRLMKAGYSLFVTNRTIIIHTPGKGSLQSADIITDKILLNSQYIFFKKHHGILYAWISFITIWSIITAVVIYQLIFNYKESNKTTQLWKWHFQSFIKCGGLPKATIPDGGKEGVNYTWSF